MALSGDFQNPNNNVTFYIVYVDLIAKIEDLFEVCEILMQVPKGIESNKGNVFIGRTTPNSVVEAYFRQFQKDFPMFLKYRAKELITGGRMVLTMVGRISEDLCSEEYCYVWGFLTLALNSMVVEVKYGLNYKKCP